MDVKTSRPETESGSTSESKSEDESDFHITKAIKYTARI